MAIGGFNNQGGNLSLSAFQHYVATGQVRFYLTGGGGQGPGRGAAGTGGPRIQLGSGFGGSGGGGLAPPPALAGTGPGGGAGPGGPGGDRATAAITNWVTGHFKSEVVAGQAVYDLTRPLKK